MNQFQNDTKAFLEDLKSGQNNILVAIRVRPLSVKEKSISEFEIIKVLDNQLLILMESESNQEDILRKNRNKETQFAFDYVFGVDSLQEQVYNKTTEFLLDGLLQGYNTTIFSYGATGSGKTYTMIGTPQDEGIMPRTMQTLFQKLNKDFNESRIQLSYLEIYNENIKDLLSNEDKNLEIREDKQHGVLIAGITEVHVKNVKDVMILFKLGTRNRAKEATDANQESSRSHAILQLNIETKERNQGIENQITISKLSLIDLAGSERAANTNNKGIRMVEGAKINQSLLVLGNCIQQLSEANEKNIKNSKLTRLLKDSLGGNCRTVMISNVSPATTAFEETYNTIIYANRAKNIKTVANRNVLQASNHVSNYAQIIQNLRQENEELKQLISQQQKSKQQNQSNLPPIQASKTQISQDISLCFKEILELQKNIFDTEEYIMDSLENLKQIQTDEQKESDILVKLKNQEKVESQKQSINVLRKQLQDLQQKYEDSLKKKESLTQQLQTLNDEDQTFKNYLNGLIFQGELQIENQQIKAKDQRNKKKSQKQEEQIKLLRNQIKRSKDSQTLKISPNHRNGSYFSYSQRKKNIKLPPSILPSIEKKKSPPTKIQNSYQIQYGGVKSVKNSYAQLKELRSKSAANQTIDLDQEQSKNQQSYQKKNETKKNRSSVPIMQSRINLKQSPYLINFVESKEMKKERLKKLSENLNGDINQNNEMIVIN